MNTDAQWLADRLESAPAPLRTRLEEALADRPVDQPIETVLMARATELLGEAMGGGPDRRTAMTLLAADALVTLACERAADTA